MPLVVAIKNRKAVVVASDIDPGDVSHQYSQIIELPNRCILLIAGNLDAVRPTIINTVLPKVNSSLSAAGLAQILHAALVLELVPHHDQHKGRVEFIVAGIDPIRHIEEPGLYYLDSAQSFKLEVVRGDAAAAGSTAAITSLLAGHSFADSTVDQIKVLAKECLSATKLRWPLALKSHIRIGVITSQNTRFQDF
jgi:20S proteasome alpha/beta subunit